MWGILCHVSQPTLCCMVVDLNSFLYQHNICQQFKRKQKRIKFITPENRVMGNWAMYLSWCKNVEEHYYVDSKIWKFSLYLWAAFGIILKLLLLCGWDIFIVSCWVDRRIEEKLNENRDMASKVASNRPVVPKWIVRGSKRIYTKYCSTMKTMIVTVNFL